MYEHVTRFIDEIERIGFERAGSLDMELTQALYRPEITDKNYRDTLDSYGLEGARPWGADVESLDLKATVALLTWVHRADHFVEGTMGRCLEDGFVYRILLRLRELDGGSARPTQVSFWREKDPLGCCSNWHPTGFNYRGTHFSTGEHWMMWQKACLMGDWEKAEQILSAPTPRRAKELGGKVAPYDGALWDAVREQMVYYGVREKFMVNGLERNLLLSTGSALLAEASPYDRVWGVGMAEDDPRFASPAKWEGENLLGRACMRARADIRQLAALGRFGLVCHEWPDLDPVISRMTLLQLSRMPSARAAVYCYATIVSHAAPHVYPSAGAYLKKEHDATVEAVTESMQFNMGAGLPVAGWYEFVRELEIQHALGRL